MWIEVGIFRGGRSPNLPEDLASKIGDLDVLHISSAGPGAENVPGPGEVVHPLEADPHRLGSGRIRTARLTDFHSDDSNTD